MHKRAAAKVLGRPVEEAIAAPPTADFRAVLDALQNGRIPPGSRKRKTVALGWCLFEAARDGEREFLETASVISIMQDGRGARILARYTACGSSKRRLEVRRGILFQMGPDKPGSLSLAELVGHGIDALATRRAPHPGMPAPRVGPSRDHQLVAHVQQHIEMFTADGAADEQLAGRLLTDFTGTAGEKLYPRLRYIVRDRPHASRRLLQRTWCKDDFLEEIQQSFLFRPYSVAKILKHSHMLQQRFVQLQTADGCLQSCATPALPSNASTAWPFHLPG
jgi:hypothetical protein